MDETSAESASLLTDKSHAVALITLARYLADRDQGLSCYLQASLRHAREAGLGEADLAMLRLLVTATSRP